MTLNIMKLVFTIVISSYWSTSTANVYGNIPAAVEFPISYVDESLQHLCENELISLNFSNAVITNINEDFISSPLITCLNLTGNNIERIGRGAFNKLSNLTQLFLSDNRLSYEFFNFGGHYKLQVLVMNNAYCCSSYNRVQIFEYPNLEILSLRMNLIKDLYFSTEKIPSSRTTSTIMQDSPFPKLRILDLSKNKIGGHKRETNFLTLLPNSLYFLDLHDNLLETLNLNKIANLSILNLDKNYFRSLVCNYVLYHGDLSLAGLKNLRYLSVSANNIERTESNAFKDNNELLYLNLSANKIHYLYPETFANLQYLKTLDLSNNRFENVPSISNEIGIRTLYINHNNITKLMSQSFAYMPKLTKLLLGENKINEIDVNAFDKLSVLEKLDLSRNMLNSLPEGWSKSLISLKYLDLSDNQFTSLESLSLTTAPLSLIETYLMMNPLDHLNVRYFESLPQNLTVSLMNKSNFTKWMRMDE